MSYSLKEISDISVWEAEVFKRPEANFLQSWNWGAFQEKLGKTVIRYHVIESSSNTCVGIFSCIKEEAKRGTYLAVPGGPLLDWKNQELVRFVFKSLHDIGVSQAADFIRFRPQIQDSQLVRNDVHDLGARESQMHLTADLTLQLDLTQTKEKILSQMRKNHRSLIRKADRLGITIKSSKNPRDIREFFEIQLELAEKHGFVPFGYDFLHEQFKVFAEDGQAELITAYHEGKLLASSYILYYNSEAVYHYGVSTPENKKLPGSYASQWAAICAAKEKGCKTYNFWGIAPKDMSEHRFAGVSLFKRGFGGQEIQYLPAHDIPLSSMYTATVAFEFIRKKVRKL